jgi:uncharacterized Zn finger protein (UPF0148 family)
MNFCARCGATPHFVHKGKHYCSIKCRDNTMTIYIQDIGGNQHEVETKKESVQEFLQETERKGFVTLKDGNKMMVQTISLYSDKPFQRN